MAKTLSINSFDDADDKIFEFAKHDRFITKKEVAMNEKIENLKAKFKEETAEAVAAKNALDNELTAFCLLHKNEFNEKRSKKLTHGTLSLRTTTPKVLVLNRKYTVKTAVELVKKVFSEKYIRVKEELNKESMLSDRSQGTLTDEQLAAVGLRVDQSENVKIDVDWESIENN